MVRINRRGIVYNTYKLQISKKRAPPMYTPSKSSFVFTTYNTPPASDANLVTLASNSSSNRLSRSNGDAPITGGSSARRYDRKTLGSNDDADVDVEASPGGGVKPSCDVEPFVVGIVSMTRFDAKKMFYSSCWVSFSSSRKGEWS